MAMAAALRPWNAATPHKGSAWEARRPDRAAAPIVDTIAARIARQGLA